jgi:dynein regulatory complex subunit 2
MLDKNLDEAENQYQIAIRNHLIHIETLLSVQDARIKGLQEEFRRDIQILEDEYVTERG